MSLREEYEFRIEGLCRTLGLDYQIRWDNGDKYTIPITTLDGQCTIYRYEGGSFSEVSDNVIQVLLALSRYKDEIAPTTPTPKLPRNPYAGW